MHMWMQIVGKPRWALAPTQNHWWQVPLYVSSRGLTTTPIPYRARTFEVLFDFIDHRLVVETSDGTSGEIALRPRPVADFYREYMGLVAGRDRRELVAGTRRGRPPHPFPRGSPPRLL